MTTRKVEKKPTAYVVLRSDDPRGPFTVIGNYTTHGQVAAKKAAAADVAAQGSSPEGTYFVAVPASSFYPEKAVVQMTITFLSDEGVEEPEEEDPDETEEGEDDPAASEDTEETEPEDDPDLDGLR